MRVMVADSLAPASLDLTVLVCSHLDDIPEFPQRPGVCRACVYEDVRVRGSCVWERQGCGVEWQSALTVRSHHFLGLFPLPLLL